MSDNNIAIKSLLKGISYLIKDYINKSPIDKTETGIIISIKNNNLYDVKINEKIYTNIPSIFTGFKENEIVKIKIPQNQYSQMYIEGKLNMKISGGDGNNPNNDWNNLINIPNSLVYDINYNHTDNNYTNEDKNNVNNFKSHIDDKNNPHNITKEQLGLENVDNTADINKSVKYAKTAGEAKASDVFSWAKQENKPEYTYSEIKDTPTIPDGVEIIDNLDSILTTASLSANQGRILNKKMKDVIISKNMPLNQKNGDFWYEEI